MKDTVCMKPSLRKTVRVFHMILAACVFGGFVSILCLLLMRLDDPAGAGSFSSDLGILRLFNWAVSAPFFTLMGTSLIFGLFSEWGFFKHRWIIVKWAIVAAMFALTLFGLGPAVGGMASISDAGINASAMSAEYLGFIRRAILFTTIELASMTALFVISSLKLWGKREVKRVYSRKILLAVLIPVIALGMGFAAFNEIRLNETRNAIVEPVDMAKAANGLFAGEAEAGNLVYKVNVTVEGGRITAIAPVEIRHSPYFTYATGVFNKIMAKQNVDVDAVTGATTTSKAFMMAVRDALVKAGAGK